MASGACWTVSRNRLRSRLGSVRRRARRSGADRGGAQPSKRSAVDVDVDVVAPGPGAARMAPRQPVAHELLGLPAAGSRAGPASAPGTPARRQAGSRGSHASPDMGTLFRPPVGRALTSARRPRGRGSVREERLAAPRPGRVRRRDRVLDPASSTTGLHWRRTGSARARCRRRTPVSPPPTTK